MGRLLPGCPCSSHTAARSLPHPPACPAGLVYRAMGFPPQFFTVLFAIPRIAGYLAHWRETLADPDTKIVRPQQDYRVRVVGWGGVGVGWCSFSSRGDVCVCVCVRERQGAPRLRPRLAQPLCACPTRCWHAGCRASGYAATRPWRSGRTSCRQAQVRVGRACPPLLRSRAGFALTCLPLAPAAADELGPVPPSNAYVRRVSGTHW